MPIGYVIAVLATLIACTIHVIVSGVKNHWIVKTASFVPLILAFILATRNSFLWFLLGVSYDK